MKNIGYKCVCLLVLFLSASCEDYLERYPLDRPSDQTFLTNQSELELAVNGCYRSLWYHPSDGMTAMALLDAASDIGWDRNGSHLQLLGKGSQDANNNWTGGVWTAFYQGIGRCNFVLDNTDRLEGKVAPDVIAKARAEVRFLRAYFYHQLSEYFGAVPLITKSLSLKESQVPKTDKNQVVDFLLTELDEAARDLPATYSASQFGKATKGAALAIKSRVALYNGRWDVAAQSAKAVMDLNVYQLHPNYGELFSYAGQTSKEIIFSVQYLKGVQTTTIPRNYLSRMAQGFSNKIPVQALIDSYEATDGLTIDKSPLYDPKNPFANRDPRLGFTVAVPGSVFFNYQFETHKDSLQVWDYNQTPAWRIANTEATHAFATFSGYCWRKYTDMTDKVDVANSELNFILARYAEVLLNYAEARIEAGQTDQSVYDAINAVRGRQSVKMPLITPGKSQEELRSIVRKERKYELAGEGLRLFDIRRWRIAEQVMTGPLYGRIPNGLLATAPVIDANGTPSYVNVPNRGQMRLIEQRQFNPARDYLWPIPQLETEINPQLEQNTGY